MSKPLACHHIKESEISQINDSILDVGYFVVSDKLNLTAALRPVPKPAIIIGIGVTVKQYLRITIMPLLRSLVG